MYVGGFRKLFAFKGYVIEKVRLTEELAQVNLRRDRRFNLTCPHCGAKMGKLTLLELARPLCLYIIKNNGRIPCRRPGNPRGSLYVRAVN
jgi:hypothetical protein